MKLGLVLWAVSACAQSAIEVPTAGTIVDSSGSLTVVRGVAGNFSLDRTTVTGILAAACSERLCLAKTDGILLSPGGATDAPPGPAIFGIDGDSAVVYFPAIGTFARWRNDALEPLDWNVDGEVLSIRPTEIAVRRAGRVWVVGPDGAVLDWIADTAGPVLLLPDGVLFATPDQVTLRRDDGSETRFDLADAKTIVSMGANYAAIRARGSVYALRTEAGRESLYLLPGTAP